jgi:hypothetical protein
VENEGKRYRSSAGRGCAVKPDGKSWHRDGVEWDAKTSKDIFGIGQRVGDESGSDQRSQGNRARENPGARWWGWKKTRDEGGEAARDKVPIHS